MRFDVLTLHPDICVGSATTSILGRACAAGHIEISINNIREHGIGHHRVVDDSPYGGGSGMVMRVDVVHKALKAVQTPESRVLLMDPAGVPFTQSHAQRLSGYEHLIFICGHYEGLDGRVRENLVDEVFSVGDYVLTGGELPAMTMVDAIARLRPNVLGNASSLTVESFGDGLLEAPSFTRPKEYNGWEVPPILLSGHHKNIDKWRKGQSEELTKSVRPDLWLERNLKENDS